MTEMAYMVREDWAQNGTAMNEQSERIRQWLGLGPYVFATGNPKPYRSPDSADREFVRYLRDGDSDDLVVTFDRLSEIPESRQRLTHAVVALHPHEDRDCETFRKLVQADAISKLFVIVWSPQDIVRLWLAGVGAINLHPGTVPESAPDAVQIEAARCWVDEQYNGLGHGNGKAAVVQLLRAFTAAGYPLDVSIWIRAYFAAGGTFGHASDVEKLIKEMQRGVRHRIKPRYRDDILDVLHEQATQQRRGIT